MFKRQLIVLFLISFGTFAQSNFQPQEESKWMLYATANTALLAQCIFSHGSKQVMIEKTTTWWRHITAVTLCVGSRWAALFVLKEAGESIMQSITPDLLKHRKSNLTDENNNLKRHLEDLKQNAVSKDGLVQKDRIDALKEKLLIYKLEKNLTEINRLLDSCQFGFLCSNNSLLIANILVALTEQVLDLYPGFTDDELSFISLPDFKPIPTGEYYVYSDKTIFDFSEKYHLKTRIPNETIVYLKETLENYAHQKNSSKTAYFQHFLNLLGIKVKL